MENKFDILKSHPGHVVTVILSAGMFWAGMDMHECGDNSAEHLDLIAKKGAFKQQQNISHITTNKLTTVFPLNEKTGQAYIHTGPKSILNLCITPSLLRLEIGADATGYVRLLLSYI